MTENSRQTFKYSFNHFKGLSVIKNCLRPKSAPLGENKDITVHLCGGENKDKEPFLKIA